jgi:antitoxin component YwqK of YwqJK toxin-antitoxin module
MALILCYECEKEISDQAPACPHCGAPKDGVYKTYHENGQLRRMGTYTAGEYDGPYELYDENGQVMDKGSYHRDQKCGEWIGSGETVTYDPCPPASDDDHVTEVPPIVAPF